jgi:hypothetical protein
MSDEKPAASQFDSWHALIQMLPAPADDRGRAIAIWNAALEAAVDNLGVDKNMHSSPKGSITKLP